MFPQFLNPATAAIAAAVAVPLLLLLYFLKLRRQPAYVSSTLLWKKAVQDLQVNSPFQRLRRNLLLLLQLLLLLLLVLALSRPVSSVRATAGDKSVILIDHSASMNATDGPDGSTRLDEAKEQALALVDTMNRG
ncbi:MAG: BatA domain-containing protein, partial [Planctomycetota bacterium]